MLCACVWVYRNLDARMILYLYCTGTSRVYLSRDKGRHRENNRRRMLHFGLALPSLRASQIHLLVSVKKRIGRTLIQVRVEKGEYL